MRSTLPLLLALSGLFACGDDDGSPAAGRDAFVAPVADGGGADGGGADAADGGLTDLGPAETDGGATAIRPDAEGPFTVSRVSGTVDGATATAFVPEAGGRVPLVVFEHGFQLATANYAAALERLASHGFVVVGVDGGGTILDGSTNEEERAQVIAAIDWAVGDAPVAGSVDPAAVGVAGHSRGGKVAAMVAATEARVSATLLLDPVNGCGPGQGFSASCPDVTGTTWVGAIREPIGIMGEVNDASGFMPCAPADQNYVTLYEATTAGWRAEWTFTGADHMDFTSDGGGTFGSFCSEGPGDDTQIRAAWTAMMVAFFRLHLTGETAMTSWLTGPELPSGITLRTP